MPNAYWRRPSDENDARCASKDPLLPALEWHEIRKVCVAERAGMRVLDIGCRDILVTRAELALCGPWGSIEGFDPYPQSPETRRGDLLEWQSALHRGADYVICKRVLCNIKTNSQVFAARNLARLTDRSGARLLVLEPDEDRRERLAKIMRLAAVPFPRPKHNSPVSGTRIARAIVAEGLRLEQEVAIAPDHIARTRILPQLCGLQKAEVEVAPGSPLWELASYYVLRVFRRP